MLPAPTLHSVARATANAQHTIVARRCINHVGHVSGFSSKCNWTSNRVSSIPDFNFDTELARLSEDMHASDGRPKQPSTSTASPMFTKTPSQADLGKSKQWHILTPRHELRRHTNALPPSRSLFLTNISPEASENDIIELFERHDVHGVLHAHISAYSNSR